MKGLYFFLIFFVITTFAYSQEPELKLDISNFGSIITLLNNSQINSGNITFSKSNSGSSTTTTYKYEDGSTSIRVESITDTQLSELNRENIYFDTRSANFQLFNIKVGTTANEVIKQLGTPLQHSNSEIIYIRNGYYLSFSITNNRVSRIIYNPES